MHIGRNRRGLSWDRIFSDHPGAWGDGFAVGTIFGIVVILLILSVLGVHP